MNNRKEGLLGEAHAIDYMKSKGMRLLERNYSTHLGEIDAIMLDGDTIVFVEVKTRTSEEFGRPEDAVDKKKQQTIIAVAMEYISIHRYFDYNVRFDVIAILRDRLTHIKNAFDLTSASFPNKYRY